MQSGAFLAAASWRPLHPNLRAGRAAAAACRCGAPDPDGVDSAGTAAPTSIGWPTGNHEIDPALAANRSAAGLRFAWPPGRTCVPRPVAVTAKDTLAAGAIGVDLED
jgi:hypothetical protein